jgi:nitrate reductase cytochrome c-type subunit
MNFKESMSKMEFATEAGIECAVTRKSWNGAGHVIMFAPPNHQPQPVIVPHNIDGFAVKFNPCVDDVMADDWEEFSLKPLIITGV